MCIISPKRREGQDYCFQALRNACFFMYGLHMPILSLHRRPIGSLSRCANRTPRALSNDPKAITSGFEIPDGFVMLMINFLPDDANYFAYCGKRVDGTGKSETNTLGITPDPLSEALHHP